MEDYVFSLKREVIRVENVVSLMLLVSLEDFVGLRSLEESEGVSVLELGEMVISEVAICDGQGGSPWGREGMRFVLK